MRLLIDTNIFLEIILDQQKAKTAKDLLEQNHRHDFFLSDYSLHSIGVLLFRRKQHEIFQRFLRDIAINGGIAMISASVEDLAAIAETAQKFQLDFDDSYQYVTAQKNGLAIVSFDADFDRTENGRMAPEEILSI